MPESLTRYEISTMWSLLVKERGRIARRGRRTSESSMEFEKRASQYDELIEKLESMTQALGPLPGLTAKIAPDTNVRAAPTRVAPKRLVRPVQK